MSTNDPFGNDQNNFTDAQTRPPMQGGSEFESSLNQRPMEKGGGGGGKTCLIIAIVCGVLGLLIVVCCGTFSYLMFRGTEMSDKPAEVQAKFDEVLAIDMPEDFKPMVWMKMAIPFMGDMDMFMFEDHAGAGVNMFQFMRFTGTMAQSIENDPNSQEQMRQQMNQQLGNQVHHEVNPNLKFETDIKDVEINGQNVAFQFVRGLNKETNELEELQATGLIKLDTGPIVVQFMGSSSKYSEEDLIKILKSIRNPGEPYEAPAEEPSAEEQPEAEQAEESAPEA